MLCRTCLVGFWSCTIYLQFLYKPSGFLALHFFAAKLTQLLEFSAKSSTEHWLAHHGLATWQWSIILLDFGPSLTSLCGHCKVNSDFLDGQCWHVAHHWLRPDLKWLKLQDCPWYEMAAMFADLLLPTQCNLRSKRVSQSWSRNG